MDKKSLHILPPAQASLPPLADNQERQTKNIPATQPIRFLRDCLGAGERVDEMPGRKARANRHNSIIVKTDGAKRRQAIYNSNSQTVTIELTDIEKLIGKKKGVTKLFTLSLIKLCEQALASGELVSKTLQITINELIAQGFYADAKGARRGFDNAMDILTSIKLHAEAKQGKNSTATAKAVEVLFTGYERDKKGNCFIHLNERIDWALLAQFYTVIPTYYPRLTSNGLDLLHTIFTYARYKQNRESLAKNGYFNISLRAVQDTLCLPDEEKTKNPERDIKSPIDRAIEDIENQEQAIGLLKLTPSVDGTEPIREYLEGYIKVELTGEYSRKLEEITETENKKIEANKKRQRKVEDKAKTLALSKKLAEEPTE